MVNSYKKAVNDEKLQVKPPVKNENKHWSCGITYDSSPFLIQTPRIRIVKETGTLLFKVQSKKEFLDYLSSIEKSICNILYNNSEQLFSGKSFSMEKIMDSLSPSWDIDDDGLVYLQPSNSEEDLVDIKCVDMFNNEISYESLQENVSAIMHVESVLFTKKLFKIVYKIHRLKMTKFVESRLVDPFKEDKVEEVKAEEDKVEDAISKLDISDEGQENLEESVHGETHDDADFFD